MKVNQQPPSGGGIGFLGGLTLIFITLKLMGYINWSWWWVLAPLWGSVLITLAFMLLVVLVFDWNNK